MRIGLVTSWHERCGISSYSEDLVAGLEKKGVEVKVCANYPKDQLLIDEPFVKRLWHCPFMTHKESADTLGMFHYLEDCDLIHIQFETSLYHPSWFPRFVRNFKDFSPRKIVLTMHSSGMWSDMDTSLIDHFITHEPMGWSQSVIPMGVQFFEDINNFDPTLITSFGLGRNNDELIKAAIENTEFKFEPSYGSNNWLSKDELIKNLNRGIAVCLLYPTVGANVSSSAATLALGCSRPIFVTDTNWFRHVRDIPGIIVIKDLADLHDKIVNYLPLFKDRAFLGEVINNRREEIIKRGRTFNDFINKHVEVYNKLIF